MSRAQQISEAIDGFLLRPIIRDQFFKEKNKFYRQSTKPPLSRHLEIVRNLVDNQDFDCANNVWAIPTIGADSNQAIMIKILKHVGLQCFEDDFPKQKRHLLQLF